MPHTGTTMSSDPVIVGLPSEDPKDVHATLERIDCHSRRISLRRQSIALNAVINQRRVLLGALINEIGSNISLPTCISIEQDQEHPSSNAGQVPKRQQQEHRRPSTFQLTPVATATGTLVGMDMTKALPSPLTPPTPALEKTDHHKYQELMSTLSTLYAKLLVVVGVAIPVTASVSQGVPVAFDQGFYLYLYLTSVAFVVMLYITLMRDKAVKRLLIKHGKDEKTYDFPIDTGRLPIQQAQQYGSFCLRLGAVGFGAGSLVLTGLQIGAEVATAGAFRAVTPATRLLLVTTQMHFIFLNSTDFDLARHGALAKLGLMHMIATNLCEWLQALVQETHHEISQLEHEHESKRGILASLLADASPFLFPCTIEFSLICAVILFEMWKKIDEKQSQREISTRSLHQLSIDCSSAHRGLFGGILVISATVLSLIMFFVLKDEKPDIAVQQVTVLEASLLTLGIIASVGAAIRMRNLESKPVKGKNLDDTLLAAAQAGVYLHCLFGVVGGILTTGPNWGVALTADLLALIQSTVQTLLIKVAWRRRSATYNKPGKELITFLIVANIALWSVNTLEKSRAGVRPDHLKFFGVWAWTIITHVSMPLAIFFRFHSAICLFEVWKSCYKYRPTSQSQTPY
ncbi:proton channel OtopLc-like isoform X2 [Athalia rosae]|uniref:proton channel OtopLc-like isoform X2 n=1 Tax=Athalia rosae TaxID=37344 RepID=UPI0020338A94|nr:proton channel OtopLc-like isoform X2 [Athalia rosae]XP_048511030.1 proton channel OtopLc-like isoform X2 [Athalia rosae]XP_048511031.1 proton channel OtopLc-like isoform X2 [Athalia rosae]XP_048511032.1 proton channel OtopLc-like isoform X2 [Athalia rosae]XP_048511034.1 proton channel OtopLc-like isoform X2 [Athalia rosae]XP_048511035.1 proton channel OtopLc-like isoform X2 [Athalia rosae]